MAWFVLIMDSANSIIILLKEKIFPLTGLTDYEKGLVEQAIPDLKKEIAKGVNFIKQG